jgi:hypothetical protein
VAAGPSGIVRVPYWAPDPESKATTRYTTLGSHQEVPRIPPAAWDARVEHNVFLMYVGPSRDPGNQDGEGSSLARLDVTNANGRGGSAMSIAALADEIRRCGHPVSAQHALEVISAVDGSARVDEHASP